MRDLFMSAGVVTAIVLCVVGIIKLPFKNFKVKHPIGYKIIFTTISLVISIVLCVLDELYILCGQLLSVDFSILICVVLAGVFCGYSGVYEGLGLKDFVKKIIANIKKAKEISKDKKVVKYLNKIDDVEKAIAILEERKNNKISEV